VLHAQNFREAIAAEILVGDGAMGTQLQAAGLEPGCCGEAWNIHHPERILSVHQSYVDAGSDCIATNTFGGCRLALGRHGMESEVERVNRVGVELARSALGERRGFVLGDLGPFGGMLEPLGTATAGEVRDGFLEQATYLVDAGVDAILIETMTALDEVELAISAAREAGAPYVIATMAFDSVRGGEDFRTMMGTSPEQAAAALSEWGADAGGCNCGSEVDAEQAVRILRRFQRSCSLPLVVQPNAGTPSLVEGRVIYRQDVRLMAQQVDRFVSSGARLIGACCGSTPEHIAAIRRQLELPPAG
jgi:5-methyltetrahydrofolate--homocysteine methyltransferase